MNKTFIKPNFFIVGAAKSATTSIYHYLSQHPDVFFPTLKEPKYFSAKYIKFPQTGPGDFEFTDKPTVKNLEDYLNLYQKASSQKIIGDASVDNLYYYQTAEDIKKFSPDAKILIILRNPVDRAFSHYSHFRRDGRESEDFGRALELEDRRIQMGFEFSWHYLRTGLYYQQVKKYLDVFDTNVKVLTFDDFNSNPDKFIKEICTFLALDYAQIKDINLIKHNKSGKSKISIISTLTNGSYPIKEFLKKILTFKQRSALKAFVNQINTETLPFDKIINKQLKEYFTDDIVKLEELLKIDLSSWK